MSFNFEPLTEAELQTANLIEPGVYDFEVIKSTKRPSKAGNPMAELTLNVWDKKGKTKTVFDYLVFTSAALSIKKIKHFCDSTGLVEEYKKGSLPEELVGLSGKVAIDIQDEMPKPSGGYYPSKNVVIDYMKEGLVESKSANSSDSFKDDDIPF